KLARMKHWLWEQRAPQTVVGQTMALLRLPSLDGSSEGQKIWYDYDGKDSNVNEGTNALPRFIARVLPNGTSQYVYFERNSWRNPTNIVSTFSTTGTTVLLRTNTVSYATNDIDMLEVRESPTNGLVVAFGDYLDRLPQRITN